MNEGKGVAGSTRAATPFYIRRYDVKIHINGFEIVKILDTSGNIIEAENLIDTNPRLWNAFNIIESLLYCHIKRYDYEFNKSFNCYPYRKIFIEVYGSPNFILDLDKDINGILRIIR